MTQKELIKTQIEKRIEELRTALNNHYSVETESRLSELERTLTIIVSSKQESVSEDLEEAANNYGKKQYGKKISFNLPDRCRGCYEPIVKGFKAGAQWQKEQILRDAIDGCVKTEKGSAFSEHRSGTILTQYVELGKFKCGDTVKVIILKDD